MKASLSSRARMYGSLFRVRFINGLQYRAAAAAGVCTQFAWGFMEILLFRAFYQADPPAFPMEFSALASYIWLQQAFLALFMSWFLENDVFAAITDGNIAYELARPIDLYSKWFIQNLAGRVSRALLRCAPILLVAALLPAPYGLSLPSSPLAFAVFLPTMALGLCTVVSFCMIVYIATFYTLSPLGVRVIALSITDLLTGSLVPLPFFPDTIRRIVELTPFASMQNLPLRVYSGNIAGEELIRGVLVQVFWLAALVIAGRLWMRHALRRIVVQGG